MWREEAGEERWEEVREVEGRRKIAGRRKEVGEGEGGRGRGEGEDKGVE